MHTEDLVRETLAEQSGQVEWRPQLHAAVDARATWLRRRRAAVTAAALAAVAAVGVTIGAPYGGGQLDRAASRPRGLVAEGAAQWPVRGDLAGDPAFASVARRAWNLHSGTVFADSRVLYANVITGGRVAVLIGHDRSGQQRVGAIVWWDRRGSSQLIKSVKVDGSVDVVSVTIRKDYQVLVLSDPSAEEIEWSVAGTPARTESLYNGVTYLAPHYKGPISATIWYDDKAVYSGPLD